MEPLAYRCRKALVDHSAGVFRIQNHLGTLSITASASMITAIDAETRGAVILGAKRSFQRSRIFLARIFKTGPFLPPRRAAVTRESVPQP